MSEMGLLILAVLLVVFLIALMVGVALCVTYLVWLLYGAVVPYFFGSFAPSIHAAGYHLIHPDFWPFLGMWILLMVIIYSFTPFRKSSKKNNSDDENGSTDDSDRDDG